MISIYVAMTRNRVIGRNNELPWRISADLKRPSQTTRGHKIIMGRKTHESILKRLGKPLPERQTIVITRQKDYEVPEDCIVTDSIQKAVALVSPSEEAFVFGGAEIYNLAIPYTDKLYLTKVEAEVEGDAYFPELNWADWELTSTEPHQKDEKNEFNYTFEIYERRR
ncbi:MAG: dihydrofolate reductase [Candidatus Paceibacterota bacterium]|jgi:dihydrofolate reductase